VNCGVKKILLLVVTGYCIGLGAVAPSRPRAVVTQDGTAITEKQMRAASKELSAKEMANMKMLIQNNINEAKANKDTVAQQEYEVVFQDFWKGRYDLVMQELLEKDKEHGGIQNMLQMTGLRAKMLAGELEKVPWFIRQIAGLDWFLENDPTLNNVWYLISLVDQIDRNNARVEDPEMLLEAINDLGTRLVTWQPKSTKILQRSINQALDKLMAVKNMRNLQGPVQY
jgi:hypothetical protein